MPYTKQTWADDEAGGTPLSAARLAHIEDGIGDNSVLLGTALQRANNLSDIGSTALARANLGITDPTVLPVGQGPGTIASGNDSRIVGALQKTSNLADLTDPFAAKGNLGMGNVDNTPDTTKPVSTPQAAALALKLTAASNLSDLASAATARTNLGVAADTATVHKGELVFNVKDYGAVGNFVADDTAAINSAITAAGPTKGIVYFPPGTYKIGTWSGVAGTISSRAITPLPGITLRGASRAASVLKVANSLGNYFTMIGPPTAGTDLSGLTVEHLTFDNNTTNNVVASVPTMISGLNYRASIVVYTGSRITIRACRFTDIDAVWTTAVNSATGTDITITDNLYDNYGTSAAFHDCSAIYTSGRRTQITNNTFVANLGGLGAATAIETHGDLQVVSDNNIENFFRGMNITGVATTSSTNVQVSGNNITRCSVGIQLWSNTYAGNTSGFGMQDVVVADNTIEVDYDTWAAVASYRTGIALDQTSDYGVRNLRIQDNVIRYRTFTTTPVALDFASSGVQWYRSGTVTGVGDENIRINGNTIVNSPGAGVYFQPKSAVKRLRVQDNTIINPATGGGAAFAAAYRVGVKLMASQDSFADVRVAGNAVIDDRGTAVVTAGLDTANLAVAVTAGSATDNTLRVADGSTVTDFAQSTTVGATFRRGSTPGYATATYTGPQGTRSTFATAVGQMTCVPLFVTASAKFDRIGMEVTAFLATSVVRLGVYADNGKGVPGDLILDAGTVDAGSVNGAKEITISQWLQPGLYWLAAANQVAASTVRIVSGALNPVAGASLATATGATAPNGYYQSGVTGAFPATFALTGTHTGANLVVVRAA